MLIKYQIDFDSLLDYLYFVTQKAVSGRTNLNAEEVIFFIKKIDSNADFFAQKVMVAIVFEIDSVNIYRTIVLLNHQSTTVLLQILY